MIAAAITLTLLGMLGAGTATAGKLGKAPVGYCTWPMLSQPFAPWNDDNPYFLIDGGSFEGSLSGWTLSGGASVGQPNEPFKVNSSSDSTSLRIPNAASVTSPQVCVTVDSPALRLFYVNSGGADRPLQIFVNYTGADGKAHSAKLQDQKNAGIWAPSPSIKFLNPLQDVLKKNGQTSVSFTLLSPFQKDHPGNWRIDDFYIDPLKSH